LSARARGFESHLLRLEKSSLREFFFASEKGYEPSARGRVERST
jgi:hypothetical protein